MTDAYKIGMWQALCTVKLAQNPNAIQNPGLRAQVKSPVSGFRQPTPQGAVGQPPKPAPPTNAGPTPGTGPGTPGPTGTPNPPSPGGNPFSSPAAAPAPKPAGNASTDVGGVIGATSGAPVR
jgi:hypothetical protein